MKNRYLLLVYILTILSCKKDFLERTPSDFISEGEVFGNLENATNFLNNAYNQLPDYLTMSGTPPNAYNLGAGTDELAYMHTYPLSAREFNTGSWNPVSFPMQWLWTDYYMAIRRINIFIKNYDLIPEEVSSGGSSRKRRLLGEAYGLRAFYYFQLYKMWGAVPLIDKPLDPSGNDNIMLERSNIDDVVAFIKKDVAQAVSLLPPRLDDSQFGRMNATVAKALLSRLTLYYASPLSNPGNNQERWQEAVTATKEAIDIAVQAGHSLSLGDVGGRKAYERIFLELRNPEVIWTKNITTQTGTYVNGPEAWDFFSSSLGYAGWYGFGPLQEMVDSYEMINGEIPVLGYTSNGAPIVNPVAAYDPQHPFVNRDPRFYQCILYHGAMWQGRAVNVAPGGLDNNTSDRGRINYFCRKYVDEGHNLFSNSGTSYRRYAIFRLGELYLNYAEALNEVSGHSNEVYDMLNMIRDRAGMPPLPAGLSQGQLRERIRHERKIELAFESHRFWDVRRWKIAEQVDKGPVHGIAVSAAGAFSYPVFEIRIFDKNKHYLFPVPQLELDKNHLLIQNSGW
ncbi:RagB/SusD family nutrient uptake outer membrane protein [Chitinophaga defluvii]|uniref:RagB/SusD family nutrient uptake outer membrane protein n=1 Tax=Chitinophaga defluvii TaxID=3163343 RepID=A0ABV2TEA3_9BACT